jgi:hypothetical protein
MKTSPDIWSLFLGLLIIPGLISCEDIWNRCVDGNGTRINETRELENFERIQVNGDFTVQIDTGNASYVVIRVDENLTDLIVTHVSGDRLIIETRNNDCIRPSHPVEITVVTPAYSEITLSGSGIVRCSGLNTNAFSINLEGSGEIQCNQVEAATVTADLLGSGFIEGVFFTENLSAALDGSGEIRMSGASVNADLKLIGSGRIQALDVVTDVCYAYVSGSGRIDTRVNNALDITIIGSGSVYYAGNPTVESYISGSGKVVHQ